MITEIIGNDIFYNVAEIDTDLLLRKYLLFSPQDIADINMSGDSLCLLTPHYLVDLQGPEYEILKRMDKAARTDLSKAERHSFEYIRYHSPTDKRIEEFCSFYNQFADWEKLKEKCDTKKLLAIRDKGALTLTYIKSKDGEVLCGHAYFNADQQAIGLYTPVKPYKTEDKNYIERASEYLHWSNILYCKEKGFHWYELAEQILDSSNKVANRRNEFYQAFGPTIAYYCNIYNPETLLGKNYMVFLKRHIKKKKNAEYTYTQQILKNIES